MTNKKLLRWPSFWTIYICIDCGLLFVLSTHTMEWFSFGFENSFYWVRARTILDIALLKFIYFFSSKNEIANSNEKDKKRNKHSHTHTLVHNLAFSWMKWNKTKQSKKRNRRRTQRHSHTMWRHTSRPFFLRSFSLSISLHYFINFTLLSLF